MNKINVDIDFTNGTLNLSGIDLITGDYNSTEIDFTFDEEHQENRKVFEMKSPTDEVVFVNEIIDNKIILTALDENEHNVSLFQEEGYYIFEVSCYSSDSKLTSVYGKIPVQKEQVIIDGEVIEPYLPIFDQLMQDIDSKIEEVDSKIEEVDTKLETIDSKIEEVDTAIEETNNLNIDIDKEDKETTITLTKKDGTTKTESVLDGKDLQFVWRGTELGIKTSDMQDYVYTDLQGVQGEKGDMGSPFTIKKTYSTESAMIADYDNMNVGDYVMIDGDIEVQENATLWVKEETPAPTTKWHYLADFSGASGIQGETGLTPNIQIGTVTSGATPSVTRSGTNENPILNFVLQKGEKGDTGNTGATGATGNGIASIVKTSTSGLVDTYTITYTNGTTTTYEVTNGEDGEVTQEQLDEVIAENDYLNSIIDQLPRVSSTGDTITLDNTIEAKMKSKLSPSEMEQETINGDNMFNLDWFTYRTNNGITATKGDGYVLLNGTATATAFINYEIPISLGSETINGWFVKSDSAGLMLKIRRTGQNDINIQPTAGTQMKQNVSNDSSYVYSGYLQIANGTTLNNCKVYIDVRKGDISLQDYVYQPYVGNQPSPNPQYPQNMHTTTGDNVIRDEGKNLFVIKNATQSGWNVSIDNPLKGKSAGDYTISCVNKYITSNKGVAIVFNNTPNTATGMIGSYFVGFDFGDTRMNQTRTLTQEQLNATYMVLLGSDNANSQQVLENMKIMIKKGSTALPYEPYNKTDYPLTLGNIEYSKIGNYEDEFIIPSGSNVFNTREQGTHDEGVTTNVINDNNVIISYNGISASYKRARFNVYGLEKNTTYTFKANITNSNSNVTSNWLAVKNITDTVIIFNNSYTSDSEVSFNTGDNESVILILYAIGVTSVTTNNANWNYIQLNKSTTALPYEPYGTDKWYLKKNIGKVVLDGSENWQNWSIVTTEPLVGFLLDDYVNYNNSNGTDVRGVSDYFKVGANEITTEQGIGLRQVGDTRKRIYVAISNTIVSDLTTFKTWLSTHNVILDYVSATPTYTLLNDTLQTQLTNIYNNMMSKKGQTNLSQVNDDLPMVITASALLDLNSLIGGN